MNKHTPGPWKSGVDLWQAGVGGKCIDFTLYSDTKGQETVLDGCGCCGSPWLNNPADAYLIETAPELLEILEEIEADCVINGGIGVDSPIWNRAREVMAKARGEK